MSYELGVMSYEFFHCPFGFALCAFYKAIINYCPNQEAMGSIVARPNGSRADVTPLYKNSYERLLSTSMGLIIKQLINDSTPL